MADHSVVLDKYVGEDMNSVQLPPPGQDRIGGR